MSAGTSVSYRGVKVGQVLSVVPEPAGVVVEIEISPADRLIPSNARVEATLVSLVDETSIDITPLQLTPLAENIAPPLSPDCDSALIICNGSRLSGEGQLDVNTLIRSISKIINVLGDPAEIATFRSLTENASDAFSELAQLSNEVTISIQEARDNRVFETTAISLSEAANVVSDEASLFLAANREPLVGSLNSLQQTSDQIRVAVSDGVTPLLSRVEQGELLDTLEVLSANAAEASANIRDFSIDLNDPANVYLLQQTLESARSVFENVNKITSDVDEITGNPELRENLRRLIDGLSNLLSSTQQLHWQTQYAQLLPPTAPLNFGPTAESYLAPSASLDREILSKKTTPINPRLPRKLSQP